MTAVADRPAAAPPPEGGPATGAEDTGAAAPQDMMARDMILFGSRLESKTLFRAPEYLPSFQFPYNPDPLARGNNYKIYDDMQDDDQVKAALAIKKDMVVNTGWQVVSDDAVIKQYMTDALKRINQTSGTGAAGFDESLRDMLSAYAYGFSLSEPVYRIDPATNWWIPSELRTRPPHTFRFFIDDFGTVEKVQQSGKGLMNDFSPNLFIHHVYQMEFGNPYGRSDLRAAHASWKAKSFVMRFYNVYLERYASPTIVGKYKPTFTKTDIAELLAVLQNMQQNTAMAIPEDAMVDFVQSLRDSSNSYGDALDKYDTKISRAILMPDLMGFSGAKTGGGSLALGKEQFKVFLGVIKKDRESLQNKITERLLKPVVAVNWGPEAAARTSFEFIPFTDDGIIEAAKVWCEGVKAAGWDPSDEEINYLRAITGFPEGPVERKAPVVLDANGQPVPPGAPGGAKGKSQTGSSGDNPDDGGDQTGDDNAAPGGLKKFALRTYAFRKLTTYEQKVDFQGIVGALNASEARAIPPMKRAARAIYADLIDQIRTKGLLRKFKPEAVNDLSPRFLKDMNMVFKNHFTDLFHAAAKEARAEIYKDVKKFAAAGDDDILLPEDFLRILQAETFTIVGNYSTEITKKAKNIIMQGLKDGVGEGPIVSQLREELSDYTDRWLGAVVRTKTTEIYNDARKSFWDSDPIASQVIEAYQFSAIIDDRTTDVCRELDGKIFDKGDFLDQVTPPLHFNCRSMLIPVTRFEPYKQDPDYVKPGKEPSLGDLKEMGGGLIVGGD